MHRYSAVCCHLALAGTRNMHDLPTMAHFCSTANTADFSGVLLCARAGRVMYAAGSDKSPSNWAQPYPIASLSKQFCAVALLKLASNNSLSLHAQLRHCPALSGLDFGAFATLSLHQLLSHSYSQPRSEAPSRLEFAYNNHAYCLLGRIIEHLARLPLGECYRQLLFRPAGMQRSSYDEQGHAANYAAAGGIISCAADLLQWNRALYHGRIIPRRLLKRMCYPHIAKSAHIAYDGFSTSHYGYGVEIFKHAGKRCYQHCGGIPGYQAKLCYIPRNDVSVVLLLEDSAAHDANNAPEATRNLQAFELSNQLVRAALHGLRC